VPLAGCLAQLGAIHVDLERFGDTLARSDAAFSRIMSRWHAGGRQGWKRVLIANMKSRTVA
jgi:hypothetical protein